MVPTEYLEQCLALNKCSVNGSYIIIIIDIIMAHPYIQTINISYSDTGLQLNKHNTIWWVLSRSALRLLWAHRGGSVRPDLGLGGEGWSVMDTISNINMSSICFEELWLHTIHIKRLTPSSTWTVPSTDRLYPTWQVPWLVLEPALLLPITTPRVCYDSCPFFLLSSCLSIWMLLIWPVPKVLSNSSN